MTENTDRAAFTRWLSPYWLEIQEKLFPLLIETGETQQEQPTQEIKRLIQILEIVRIEALIAAPKREGKGRPSVDRRPLARAFVAKAVLNLPETKTLIEQLRQSLWLRKVCGMESVPSKATFSRAFSFFAEQGLGDRVHEALITKFVSGEEKTRPLVAHVSHDSTAVEGRERAKKKPQKKIREKKTRQTSEGGRASRSRTDSIGKASRIILRGSIQRVAS